MLQLIENISTCSYVFGVFSFTCTLTHFVVKTIIFFQGVCGVCKIVVEILKRWGVILVVKKNGNSREEGVLT